MRGIKNIGSQGSEPVAVTVYDPAQQKAVLIFRSGAACERYILDTHRKGVVSKAISSKDKVTVNHFGKPLAIRTANTEQRALLGTREVLVLDDAFEKGIYKVEKI